MQKEVSRRGMLFNPSAPRSHQIGAPFSAGQAMLSEKLTLFAVNLETIWGSSSYPGSPFRPAKGAELSFIT